MKCTILKDITVKANTIKIRVEGKGKRTVYIEFCENDKPMITFAPMEIYDDNDLCTLPDCNISLQLTNKED